MRSRPRSTDLTVDADPAPSSADVQMTRQLRQAARAVDIELLDHVIIGRTGANPIGLGYCSFRSVGTLHQG